MAGADDLLPGPIRDLVLELRALYRDAGTPGVRRVSTAIRQRDDLPETVSHETVSAVLRGDGVPRWPKLESLVRQLAAMSVSARDPEAEVARFHALWSAAAATPAEHAPPAATNQETDAATTTDRGHGDDRIGQRIAHHRHRRGLSQRQLAERLGRSPAWVDKVERGARWIDKFSVVYEIADVLDVDLESLLGEDGPVSDPITPVTVLSGTRTDARPRELSTVINGPDLAAATPLTFSLAYGSRLSWSYPLVPSPDWLAIHRGGTAEGISVRLPDHFVAVPRGALLHLRYWENVVHLRRSAERAEYTVIVDGRTLRDGDTATARRAGSIAYTVVSGSRTTLEYMVDGNQPA